MARDRREGVLVRAGDTPAQLIALAIGLVVLAVVQPALQALARINLDVLLALVAAAAGPSVAILTGHGTEVITPGPLVLGAIGTVIALARTGTAAQRPRTFRRTSGFPVALSSR